jgi:hypothetical protein
MFSTSVRTGSVASACKHAFLRLHASMPGVDDASGAIHHRDRGDGRILDERQQPARYRHGVPGADRVRNRVGGVRGGAARAGVQLHIQTLARGVFSHRAEMTRVGVVLPDQQHGDSGHGEQHGYERRGRVLQFETDGSHCNFSVGVRPRASP